ncbi:S1-C subfamily serine protease [Arthrobacter sp. CAN_A6]|uniref:S1C family serine protease n=1 Tax=Arthrobacter sp. CAN_A6 TaxID=2787721 RepID=UPI0018CA9965
MSHVSPPPSRNLRPAGAIPLAVALALGLGACTTDGPPQAQTSRSASAPATAEQSESAAAPTIPEIVDEVQPSVVTIFTGGGGLGSGVIYSEDGLILTNEHVVRGNTEVEVAFADGQRVSGTVEATDVVSDLALVRADRTGLPAAEFETDLPRTGETAIVIGSPLGFENTVTAGIISGLHREIPGSARTSQSLVDLIQTDAPISPGNSGGAVVNGQGMIIGISEAYIPPQAGAVALGFAIPAATAVEVTEQLLEDGTAEHAFLGLVPGAITAQIAQQLGLESAEGAVVLSVQDGSPADDAGVRPGDVVVSMAGTDIVSPEALLAALREQDPGTTVDLTVRRDGEQIPLEVQLEDRPVSQP